jgi:hypothetical protein
MLSEKMIKNRLSKIKKLHNIEIDRRNVHIHSSKHTGYIGISKDAIEDILKRKSTIEIKTKPAITIISLWKEVPYTHTNIFRTIKLGKVV